MSNLIKALTKYITRELALKVGTSSESHYRGGFSGPPERILGDLLDTSTQAGGFPIGETGMVMSPVLLPCRGGQDPVSLSGSGRCSDSHLVKVRTSDRNRFLILLPPGHAMNESMETTIQHLGIAPKEIGEAWRTPLFEDLLEGALKAPSDNNSELYIELAKGVLRNELMMLDEEHQDGSKQWGLLEKLFDWDVTNAVASDRILALLGLFSCGESELTFKEHNKIQNALADHLESLGIRKGFEALKESAPDELKDALDECMEHIRSQCHSGSDFKVAPASVYCPVSEVSQEKTIPEWWRKLTLEVWRSLLDTGAPSAKESLVVKCMNTVVPEGKGVPSVVQSSVAFELSYTDKGDQRDIRVQRKVGRTVSDIDTIEREVGNDCVKWEDDDPPKHSSHFEYIFSVVAANNEEVKPTKLKVISLDSYSIGVVPYCRSAAKIKLFRTQRGKKTRSKKRAQKKSASLYEATLEVHGMGMHQVDLYTSSDLDVAEYMVGEEVTSEQKKLIAKNAIKTLAWERTYR